MYSFTPKILMVYCVQGMKQPSLVGQKRLWLTWTCCHLTWISCQSQPVTQLGHLPSEVCKLLDWIEQNGTYSTLMLLESVRNMVRRSMPIPQPAVGGSPYSRAVQKLSSTNMASSSPAALSCKTQQQDEMKTTNRMSTKDDKTTILPTGTISLVMGLWHLPR